MRTHFTAGQLADPQVRESEQILRKRVHCGFCTATCPTYLLTGDELDSPRGRIYLAKDMLEKNRPADPTTVKHLDRCLTCLSCMTTCPSGVHYIPRRSRPPAHRAHVHEAASGSAAAMDAGIRFAVYGALPMRRYGWRDLCGRLVRCFPPGSGRLSMQRRT